MSASWISVKDVWTTNDNRLFFTMHMSLNFGADCTGLGDSHFLLYLFLSDFTANPCVAEVIAAAYAAVEKEEL
eukprot:7502149-Ditylum_brightwellii.AAC.1